MSHLKQERRKCRIFFTSGPDHSLGRISAASRFCPRVPAAPPLNSQRDQKQGQKRVNVAEVRKQA